MKSSVRFIALLLTFLSFEAHAGLVWDWQFENPDLGVFSPFATIQARATLSNSSDSTVAFNPALSGISPRIAGAGVGPPELDGVTVFSILEGFGNQEDFPWTNFTSSLFATALAPGETYTFDFIWIKSSLASGFASGNYTVTPEILVCLDVCLPFQGMEERKGRTLSWTIQNQAAVPEPGTLLLLFSGLLFVGLNARESVGTSIKAGRA